MYAIRRSSRGDLAPGTFTSDKLHDDLDEILFARKGPFDSSTLQLVVDRTIARLERKLPDTNTRLSPSEFRDRPEIIGAFSDTLISKTVEEELRRGAGSDYRMAELLYVMAIRGRNDYRQGWPDASHVLSWIFSRYDGLAPESQSGRFADQPTVRMPSPRRAEWRPRRY